MNRIGRYLPAAVVALTVASCAPSIRSARDESIPVLQGASWAWAPADTLERGERGPSPVGEIVQQRFRRAIEAAMQARGFRQAAEAAQADFVLTAEFGEPRAAAPVRRSSAVVVGVSTGWGYGPWGFGRFGYLGPWGPWAPWGFFQPWGWGFSGPMWGGYAAPAYMPGRRVYSDRAIVLVLRDRPTGQVAWSARLGSDAVSSDMTQSKVQEVVTRVFKTLR